MHGHQHIYLYIYIYQFAGECTGSASTYDALKVPHQLDKPPQLTNPRIAESPIAEAMGARVMTCKPAKDE